MHLAFVRWSCRSREDAVGDHLRDSPGQCFALVKATDFRTFIAKAGVRDRYTAFVSRDVNPLSKGMAHDGSLKERESFRIRESGYEGNAVLQPVHAPRLITEDETCMNRLK